MALVAAGYASAVFQNPRNASKDSSVPGQQCVQHAQDHMSILNQRAYVPNSLYELWLAIFSTDLPGPAERPSGRRARAERKGRIARCNQRKFARSREKKSNKGA